MKKETIAKIFSFLEEKEGKNSLFLIKYIKNLPMTKEDLIVIGDLNLIEWSMVDSLPEGLIVHGDLTLSYSDIPSLPEGLYVGGELDVRDCEELTSLPKGLKVGGGMEIGGSGLEGFKNKELKKMVEPDGYIKGKIFR